jgi:hypothetical protein
MKTKFFLFLLLVAATQMKANNMLVKNVTTTGDNTANKTIQVQFDMSWDNSWRDGINWDAAWVFMKFKDANGNWQHVQLNTTGFASGTGTENTIQVCSDKVGAFVYRSAAGTGTFTSTTMQLQWNYGLSGLTSVTGLEVRVFAVEMVYVPQGDFNVAKVFNNSPDNSVAPSTFFAPGQNLPSINSKLSPTLTYNDGTITTLRVKGDAGIDTDNNGIVDNANYPTGYKAFYCYKYELAEQQYADFLNTLTSTQQTTLGIAGSNITLNNGQYFSSSPTKACGNSTAVRLLAFADWSGLRPITLLEFNKASYGPIKPEYSQISCAFEGNLIFNGYPAWGSSSGGGCNFGNSDGIPQLVNVGSFATETSTRLESGASYYGVLDLTGNAHEPAVKMNYFNFQNTNGNGVLTTNGDADVSNWNSTEMITYIDMICNGVYWRNCSAVVFSPAKYGFRYVRSVE